MKKKSSGLEFIMRVLQFLSMNGSIHSISRFLSQSSDEPRGPIYLNICRSDADQFGIKFNRKVVEMN